jgi:membrane-associated phospholipid phosphatase
MKSPKHWRPLPHELCFGVFLLLTWIRLSLVEGALGSNALLYLGMILANAVVIGIGQDKAWRWRVRLLLYPVAMNLVYFTMKEAIPKISPHPMDALLQRADTLLIGGDLSVRLQSFVHPFATEFLSFCYLLFFPYMLVSVIAYAVGELDLLKKFFIGLFTIYGLGFLGYSLVPAAGPWSALASQFVLPLKGGWITALNAAVVARGSNGVDVFPSLHCAISSYLLIFDYQHRRWRFRCYLIPCLGLWFSTIYLRYHYFIDVICGFGLSMFALWLASRFARPSASFADQTTSPTDLENKPFHNV